jgi:chromosome segregation ATPase
MSLAALALILAGCTESTTQKDVAQAERKLRDAQQNTREAQLEAQQNVATAQKEAHQVNRPVIDQEAVVDANRNIAEARREGAENVAEQRKDEREAAEKLQKTQREFQATQARDNFAKDAQMKLDDAEKRIDALEAQARNLSGAEKDALDARIKALNEKHDAAKDALSDLKGADLDKWTVHQGTFQSAMQDLTRDLNVNR